MWFAFEIFHSMKKGLGPCVLSLWWGILKMTRFTEQMVTADDTEGEDDRDLGPVPVSWFLSSSKAQVCPGLRRGGGRPRRFCLRWSLITVSKVDDQASQPRSSRKLETHFAINFFCNPWKHLQPWLIYSPCLRTFYCQIVCTYFLPTRCSSRVSIPSMGIHLLWWEPGTERSDLRNWVLRQRRPWRGWRSHRWGGGRARSRGRPDSSWCRCQSWRLASSRCWWCRSHHSPGHLRAASEYLTRQTHRQLYWNFLRQEST